jgi:SAM-dependent methyltransferase
MSGEPRRLIHALYDAAFHRFRPRRLRLFFDLLQIDARTRVLDVGGMPYFWRLAAQMGLPQPRVTTVNLLPKPGDAVGEWVRADGCALPFADGTFDAVFCNSVIEHVPDQRGMAREIARVGERYFVQTPSRRFPVEQHLVTVGLHWLSKERQKRWMGPLSLAGTNGRLPQPVLEQFLDDLHLLDRGELAALFPDGELRVERFVGLEKSLVVVRGGGQGLSGA